MLMLFFLLLLFVVVTNGNNFLNHLYIKADTHYEAGFKIGTNFKSLIQVLL